MKIACSGLTIWLLFAAECFSQEKTTPTYQLQIRMLEQPAKGEATTRRYMFTVENKARGKVNASRRVPYYTSTKGEAKEVHTAGIGSVIECNAEERDGGVRLHCSFESSVVAEEQASRQIPVGFLPVMHSRQATATAVVALGRETKLAQLDDPVSGGSMEIFVLAERLP